jgi:predicted RNA-binding protein with PIN domain
MANGEWRMATSDIMAHIVIDGYNLIRQSPDLSIKDALSLEKGRNALVRQLSAYKKLKGHQITVVFDAQFTTNLQIEEFSQAGIRLLFSEGGQTADDVILQMAEKGKGQLIIVSSDNRILQAAKSSGCAFLDSQEFERKLEEALLFDRRGEEMPMRDEETKPVNKRWLTAKKGPSKRLPKAKRRALARLKDV